MNAVPIACELEGRNKTPIEFERLRNQGSRTFLIWHRWSEDEHKMMTLKATLRYSKFIHFVSLTCQTIYPLISSIMSSANCPFSIFTKKDLDAMQQKDRYVSVNIPLDPSHPTSQKITHEYSKLNSTEIEDVLEFFSAFDDIMKTLAIPRVPQRFCLIPVIMGHNIQKKWFNIVTNYGRNQSQEDLENCIEQFSFYLWKTIFLWTSRNGCLK
jgi:hypothetical protein